MGFYYDHRTHWVTNTELDPILVATGDFQSEMGCPTDGDATCMRSWLQDPDRDGTYSFTTIDIPAGSYTVSIGAVGPVAFTVEEGLATTIAVQTTGSGAQRVPTAIAVETFAPDFGPDLTTSRASWLTPKVLSWNLPDDRGRVDLPPALGPGRVAGAGRRDHRRLLTSRCRSTRPGCRRRWPPSTPTSPTPRCCG